MKKLATILASLMLLLGTTSNSFAEFKYGLSGMLGGVFTDGTEHEKTSAGDSEKHTDSKGELFAGGSVFLEKAFDNGFALGIDWVPVDADLGSGSRIDTNEIISGADGCSVSGVTCGTFTASAELTDLITYYISKTNDNGFYWLLGVHTATIVTAESLPTTNYGNEDLIGYQYGFGITRSAGNGELRYQISYSDFEDISIASDNDTTQKIEADADAVMFKLSYAF